VEHRDQASPPGTPERGLRPFGLAVDVVVLTIVDDRLSVLLVRRAHWPYEGMLALPGGFVRPDRDASVDRAAQRVLDEETRMRLFPLASGGHLGHEYLEQLKTYWRPGRDPRPDEEVAAVAYLAVLPAPKAASAGMRVADVVWQPVEDVMRERVALAYDHARIVADGVERARNKLEYTTIGATFLGETFTVAQLRHVYEVIWGLPLDKRNFHRKVTETEGLLEDAHEVSKGGVGRPAQLYRRGNAQVLRRPILRPREGQDTGDDW
jgi:8-oxo-dGTP diphosphatase